MNPLGGFKGSHLSSRRRKRELIQKERFRQRKLNPLRLLNAKGHRTLVLRDRPQHFAQPLIVFGIGPGDSTSVQSYV